MSDIVTLEYKWCMRGLPALLLLTALGAGACTRAPQFPSATMNEIAERYVKLVLKVGQHDAKYVDAYYGDASWKPTGAPIPLETLVADAQAIKANLAQLKPADTSDEFVRLRYDYLDHQLSAVASRVEMLQGKKFSFDEESRRLYDAEAPQQTESEFQTVLDDLGLLLPGKGPLVDRYAAFRSAYIIPRDRLDAVFRAAIAECRARTSAESSRCRPARRSRWST